MYYIIESIIIIHKCYLHILRNRWTMQRYRLFCLFRVTSSDVNALKKFFDVFTSINRYRKECYASN